MRRRGYRRLTTVVGVCLALGAAVVASAANGGQVLRETFHYEDTFVDDDFCGVGLEVEIASVLDGKVHAVSHGPDGLAYFLQHGRRTEVLTNVASGTTLSSIANVIEKDKRVTENRDGTLTILILATGNAVLYGEDGKAIARNPGQIRFEILIDEAGTPSDPSDDVIDFLGVVKGSTGRSDDFCEAAVPALS